MKIKTTDDTCYVILSTNDMDRMSFWGASPYGGLCTCVSIEGAYRFDTRKQAEREIRENPDSGPAKAVKVRFVETATVYIKQ